MRGWSRLLVAILCCTMASQAALGRHLTGRRLPAHGTGVCIAQDHVRTQAATLPGALGVSLASVGTRAASPPPVQGTVPQSPAWPMGVAGALIALQLRRKQRLLEQLPRVL